MVEPGKRYLYHNFYSKTIEDKAAEGEKGERQNIGLTLVVERTTITNDQLVKLLDILDRATEDANTVMGW